MLEYLGPAVGGLLGSAGDIGLAVFDSSVMTVSAHLGLRTLLF